MAGEADPELVALARADLARLAPEIEGISRLSSTSSSLPRDPHDDRDAIVEIRAGTGGDEAALFAADCTGCTSGSRAPRATLGADLPERRHAWRHQGSDLRGARHGSLRAAAPRIGRASGAARPGTETPGPDSHLGRHGRRAPRGRGRGREDRTAGSQDRRLPLLRSRRPEREHDRQRGPDHSPADRARGQQQDQKSQLQNKIKAMEVLRARLLDRMIAEQEAARARERRAMVGTGDRSAKIRTYNYPQSRVTDHRINLSVHNLDDVLNGHLDELRGRPEAGQSSGAGKCLSSRSHSTASWATPGRASQPAGITESAREASCSGPTWAVPPRCMHCSTAPGRWIWPGRGLSGGGRTKGTRGASGVCYRLDRVPPARSSGSTGALSIPRPETEGLVELVLERVPGGRVADIGTGTGCIALSLATEGHYERVVALDRSGPALALAALNRQLAGAPVELVKGDLTSALASGSFDAVVSNPPYLTVREHAGLDPAVSRWEPREALVSGDRRARRDGAAAGRWTSRPAARWVDCPGARLPIGRRW